MPPSGSAITPPTTRSRARRQAGTGPARPGRRGSPVRAPRSGGACSSSVCASTRRV
nr:MAG TPA: hypothetical protein [Caudoviricetes sp.]